MGRPLGSRNKPRATMNLSGSTVRVEQPEESTMRDPTPKPQPVKVDYDRQMALEEESDMLHIPKELIPDGMRYNWKTLSVLGQQQARRFGRYEATGWSPVPASRHPGLFTPKGYEGQIEYDGLVLMEKPEELCRQTEAREFLKARSQVQAKEAQITGGHVDGVRLDTQHKSALRANKVGKSYEPFRVPEE